jgi:hypothetical protein
MPLVLRRHAPRALVLLAYLLSAATVAGQNRSDTPPSQGPPGIPASASVVAEIREALNDAIRRVEAMDEAGLLAHVSEQYRTGPVTKAALREQVRALFAVHDQIKASVRIDDVRMVGNHAWVYSTGDVTGRLRWIGGSVPVLGWDRELEVARREGGRWRLFGYQQ